VVFVLHRLEQRIDDEIAEANAKEGRQLREASGPSAPASPRPGVDARAVCKLATVMLRSGMAPERGGPGRGDALLPVIGRMSGGCSGTA